MINNLLFSEGMPEAWIHESRKGEYRKRKRLKSAWDAHLLRHPLGIMFETHIVTYGVRLTLSEVGADILDTLKFYPSLLERQIHPWNKDATFDALRAEIAKRNLI